MTVKGQAFPTRRTPPAQRLLERVEIDPESGCWLWTGSLTPQGYGNLGIGYPSEGTHRTEVAHRVAWSLLVGPIPPGCHVHHRCAVRRCVNPDHLEVLSAAEHIGRHQSYGEHCAVCGESNWYQRKDRGRQCRTCNRNRRSEWCPFCKRFLKSSVNRHIRLVHVVEASAGASYMEVVRG
jgi:hypothetical protein